MFISHILRQNSTEISDNVQYLTNYINEYVQYGMQIGVQGKCLMRKFFYGMCKFKWKESLFH